MDIYVYIDQGAALADGMDQWGLVQVSVPVEALSLKQREVLAMLLTENHFANHDLRREPDISQAFAPRVLAGGVAGVIEVVDRVLLAMQRQEYDRAVTRKERLARAAEELAAEQVEAQHIYWEFAKENSREWDSALTRHVALSPWFSEAVVCGICDKYFPGKAIDLSRLGKVLSQDQQKRVLELAKDRHTEQWVCEIDRHLEQCKAKADKKILQLGELVSLFLENATEEQEDRWKAGYISESEMHSLVRDRMFAFPFRQGPENWKKYWGAWADARKTVVRAKRITSDQAKHEQSCEQWGPVSLSCEVVEAKYLDADRYRFLGLVRYMYTRIRSGSKDRVTPRYVLCECEECGAWVIGYHVLVTRVTETGLEFSRRFAPADKDLAVFCDAAIWNDHQ